MTPHPAIKVLLKPFSTKDEYDKTKKISKFWTVQRNLKVWPLKWKLACIVDRLSMQAKWKLLMSTF